MWLRAQYRRRNSGSDMNWRIVMGLLGGESGPR
jgi:hypothetical protein